MAASFNAINIGSYISGPFLIQMLSCEDVCPEIVLLIIKHRNNVAISFYTMFESK